MQIFLWIALFFIVAICVFRLWPVSASDISADPFNSNPPQKPNFYISTDAEGEFNVSAPDLLSALQVLIETETRLKLVTDNGYQATYIERSLVMGFPDILSIKIEEISPTSASIKLFSRSKFGYSDLGVNRKRVQTLLSALRQEFRT
jgi:uncharacterized protein (DUF1499 family)